MQSIGPSSNAFSAEDRFSISVIVVSHNTRSQLAKCLRSIGTGHEVIVVDNASADGSSRMVEEEFSHVRLVSNPENRGFGAANNQGIDIAQGELILFLNSDCYAQPGAINRLALAMERASACAAGGRLLNPDGSLQQSAARMLNLWHVISEQTGLEKLLHVYWCTPDLGLAEPVPVGQVMGACLMIRKNGTIRFDEDFFLYCEDTDLIRRIVEKDQAEGRSGTVLYVPGAEFIHELGASSQGHARWLSVARYNRGKELYFLKHSGWMAASICWIIDRLGALARFIVWALASIATLFLWRPATNRLLLWTRVLTGPLSGPPRPWRKDP